MPTIYRSRRTLNSQNTFDIYLEVIARAYYTQFINGLTLYSSPAYDIFFNRKNRTQSYFSLSWSKLNNLLIIHTHGT